MVTKVVRIVRVLRVSEVFRIVRVLRVRAIVGLRLPRQLAASLLSVCSSSYCPFCFEYHPSCHPLSLEHLVQL